MSLEDACASCPFREGSPLGYDVDGIDALDDGCEPSCHEIVGFDRVFAHGIVSPAPCRGFAAYLREAPGFARPRPVG